MAKRQRDRPPYDGENAGRGTGQRARRVAEELRHLMAEILRDGGYRDPVLRAASITVSEVRISPDLRNATVYVMPLGGTNAGEIIAALKRSAPFLRGLVARRLALRYAPGLAFALDETFDQAKRISTVLARPEVARDLDLQRSAGETDDNAD